MAIAPPPIVGMTSEFGYNWKIPSNIQHQGCYILPASFASAAMNQSIFA
jgi:hypothetical protein